MSKFKFYGHGIPGVNLESLTGRLIVIEGTDSVGRSTQTCKLSNWLESKGHAVLVTGLTRSELTSEGLEQAKSGHTLGRKTMSLFYATDFADQLENHIIPALQAGYYVIADRYFYSICARSIVRGADPQWLKGVYGIALIPDLILYLKASVNILIPRALFGRGFNYWESGMDLALGDDYYDSFKIYQTKIIREFNRMAKEYEFISVDASKDPEIIFKKLQKEIEPLM